MKVYARVARGVLVLANWAYKQPPDRLTEGTSQQESLDSIRDSTTLRSNPGNRNEVQ